MYEKNKDIQTDTALDTLKQKAYLNTKIQYLCGRKHTCKC